MKPLKLTIGMKTSRPMFRLSAIGGLLIDELLANTTHLKSFSKVFKLVEQDGVKNNFRLSGDNHNFYVGLNDIQYSIDYYNSKSILDIDYEISRFISLYEVVNNSLEINDIHRIGMVCEYQVSTKTTYVSKELLEKITNYKPDGYPAKFSLQFEQRHPITNAVGIPDFKNLDFWNIIETIYDSEIDTEHSTPESISLMLDVQRYYSPYMNDKPANALKALLEKYKKQLQSFVEKNRFLGIADGNE